MMLLQQNGILKNYFLIVSLLFFINNSNKFLSPLSLIISLLFSLFLLSLSHSALSSLQTQNPIATRPWSNPLSQATKSHHSFSLFLFSLFLFSLSLSLSLVTDWRGSVEIGVQGLVWRQVFGRGVEIGVWAWQSALGWLFWYGNGHWGVRHQGVGHGDRRLIFGSC